jgi:ferric-dicitrate binding protein FerR (iron transport regulator)
MNKNSEHIDEKLLLRFLLGEVSTKEGQQVEDWLQLSENNQKLLDDYETIWAEAGKLTPNPVAVDSKSAWAKMSTRVDKFEEKKSTKTISLKTRLAWYSSSAAAIIIILFGIYQLLLNPNSTIRNTQIASVEKVLSDSLPDGSIITLNTNSKINYPKKFTKNERRVKLEGEAFFKVERNEEKPFIIETEIGFIQVLGTSFNVKAYKNKELEVLVTDGLVKIYTVDSETNDTSSILLKAGEKGKISTKFKQPVYIAENIPDEIFWMDYTLIFNDTDLKKVFNLLENYYNIEIEVSDDRIYECRLSTTFSNNSIDDIIDVIVETFDFKYNKENNTFTIKGNGCSKKNI